MWCLDVGHGVFTSFTLRAALPAFCTPMSLVLRFACNDDGFDFTRPGGLANARNDSDAAIQT